mgnify:FL=1
MTIKTKKLPCKKEVFLIRYKKRTKIIFSKILNKYYKSLINVNFIFTLYLWDKEDLILFLHDFVLVIEPEIMALFGIACQKLFHFVFIKTKRTVIAVLVIFNKICALVASVSHCCHRPLKSRTYRRYILYSCLSAQKPLVRYLLR